MRHLLRWAEKEPEPVTAATPRAARLDNNFEAYLPDNPEVLSYHRWGFFNDQRLVERSTNIVEILTKVNLRLFERSGLGLHSL